MHKWDQQTKVLPFGALEWILLAIAILLLAFLYPPSELTSWGYEIGAKIVSFRG
jgi:hypothetical protein